MPDDSTQVLTDPEAIANAYGIPKYQKSLTDPKAIAQTYAVPKYQPTITDPDTIAKTYGIPKYQAKQPPSLAGATPGGMAGLAGTPGPNDVFDPKEITGASNQPSLATQPAMPSYAPLLNPAMQQALGYTPPVQPAPVAQPKQVQQPPDRHDLLGSLGIQMPQFERDTTQQQGLKDKLVEALGALAPAEWKAAYVNPQAKYQAAYPLSPQQQGQPSQPPMNPAAGRIQPLNPTNLQYLNPQDQAQEQTRLRAKNPALRHLEGDFTPQEMSDLGNKLATGATELTPQGILGNLVKMFNPNVGQQIKDVQSAAGKVAFGMNPISMGQMVNQATQQPIMTTLEQAGTPLAQFVSPSTVTKDVVKQTKFGPTVTGQEFDPGAYTEAGLNSAVLGFGGLEGLAKMRSLASRLRGVPSPLPDATAPSTPTTSSTPPEPFNQQGYTASNWRAQAIQDIADADHILSQIPQSSGKTVGNSASDLLYRNQLEWIKAAAQQALDSNRPTHLMIEEMNRNHAGVNGTPESLVQQLVQQHQEGYGTHPDDLPHIVSEMQRRVGESGNKIHADLFQQHEIPLGPDISGDYHYNPVDGDQTQTIQNAKSAFMSALLDASRQMRDAEGNPIHPDDIDEHVYNQIVDHIADRFDVDPKKFTGSGRKTALALFEEGEPEWSHFADRGARDFFEATSDEPKPWETAKANAKAGVAEPSEPETGSQPNPVAFAKETTGNPDETTEPTVENPTEEPTIPEPPKVPGAPSVEYPDVVVPSAKEKAAKPPKLVKPRGGAKALINMDPDSEVFDPFSDEYDHGIVTAVLQAYGPPGEAFNSTEAGAAASEALRKAQDAEFEIQRAQERKQEKYDTTGIHFDGMELRNYSGPGDWKQWAKRVTKSKYGTYIEKIRWYPTGESYGVDSSYFPDYVNDAIAEHARNYPDPEYRLLSHEQTYQATAGSKSNTRKGTILANKADRVQRNGWDKPPPGSRTVSEKALEDIGGNTHKWPAELVRHYLSSNEIPQRDPSLDASLKKRGYTNEEFEDAKRYYTSRTDAQLITDQSTGSTTEPAIGSTNPVTETGPASRPNQENAEGGQNAVPANNAGDTNGSRISLPSKEAEPTGSATRAERLAAANQKLSDGLTIFGKINDRTSVNPIDKTADLAQGIKLVAEGLIEKFGIAGEDIVQHIHQFLAQNDFSINDDLLRKTLTDHGFLSKDDSSPELGTKPPIAKPPVVTTAAPGEAPTTTGGSRRVIDEHVAGGALQPIDKGVWESDEDTVKKAQQWVANGGSPDELLAKIEVSGKPATGLQFRVLQEGDRLKLKAINDAQAEASASNNPELKAALNEQINKLIADRQQYKEREQKLASQAGFNLAQLRGNLDIDTGDFAQVLAAVEKGEGRSLSSPERDALHKQVEDLKALNKAHEDNLVQVTNELSKHEQTIREAQAQMKVNEASRPLTQKKVTRANLATERQQIFTKLAQLTSRASSNPIDLVPEAAKLLGQLAMNVAAEGALSIGDLYTKVKSHLADNKIDMDFTQKDMVNAILGESKEKSVPTQEQTNKADVRAMAKAHAAIDDVWENGKKEPAPKVVKEVHPEVARLNKELEGINDATAPANVSMSYVVKEAAKGGNKTLEDLLAKVKQSFPNATIQDVIKGLSPKEGKPATLTPENESLREMRTQADLRRQIADQEAKVPRKNPLEKPLADSPEVTRLKALRDEARKNNPQPRTVRSGNNPVVDIAGGSSASDIDSLVKEVQAKHPELTKQNVLDALTEKKASAEETARQANTREFKNQAKATKDIHDLEAQLRAGQAAEAIKKTINEKSPEMTRLDTKRKNLQSLVRGMTQAQKPTNIAAVAAEGTRAKVMANVPVAGHILVAGPMSLAADEAARIPATVRNYGNKALQAISGGKLGTNQMLTEGVNLPAYLKSAAEMRNIKSAAKYAWRGQNELQMKLGQSPDQYYGSHGLQSPVKRLKDMVTSKDARTVQNGLKVVQEGLHTVGTLHGALQQMTAVDPGVKRMVLQEAHLTSHNLPESELRALSPSLDNLSGKQLRSAARSYLEKNPTPETLMKGLNYGNRLSMMSDNKISKMIAGVRSDLGKSAMEPNEMGGPNNVAKLGNAAITYAMPVAKPAINTAFRAFEYSPGGMARGGYQLLSDAFKDTSGKMTPEAKATAQDLFDRGLTGTAIMYLGAQMYWNKVASPSYLGPEDKNRAATARQAKERAGSSATLGMDTDQGMGVVKLPNGMGLPLSKMGVPGVTALAGVNLARELESRHPNESGQQLAGRLFQFMMQSYNPVAPIQRAFDTPKDLITHWMKKQPMNHP